MTLATKATLWLGVLVALFVLLWLGLVPALSQGLTTQCINNVAAQGTSDAITSAALPCATTTNLVLLTLAETNTTTTPTYQPLGSPALVITRANGNPVSPGDLQSGAVALLSSTGTSWVLLNPASASLGTQVSTAGQTNAVTTLVGDGVTLNNTAMQAIFTEVAGGGSIKFPCGDFKITAQMAVTIAQNQNVDIAGSGDDCTYIYISGSAAASAFLLTYAGVYSGAQVHDMTFVTDTQNVVSGVVAKQTTVNGSPAVSAQSRFENLEFFSVGEHNQGDYFARALDIENVSNVSVNNVMCVGPTTSYGGTCLYLNGLPASQGYGGVYNINNLRTYAANYAVYINDYIQGVTITNSNFTAGNYGVAQNGFPTGVIDQVNISTTQFGINANYDILLAAPGTGASGILYHVNISDCYFIASSPIVPPVAGTYGGIYIVGKQVIVSDNFYFEAVSSTHPFLTTAGYNAVASGNNLVGGLGGDVAFDITGIYGVFEGNSVSNFSTVFYVPTGVGSNTILNNYLSGNTTGYSVNSGASNIQITDTNSVLISQLPTCNSAITGSLFRVANASGPAYNTAFAGTGTVPALAMCNGTTPAWVSH